MYTQLNQYFVVMEVEPRFWQNPDGLKYLYVPGINDAQVPLSAFTHLRLRQHAAGGESPGAVSRRVTISFNLPAGMSLSQAVPRD